MRGFKNDAEAIALWGAAYAAIPKSVFAVAAWHLADLASDDDGAEARFRHEVECLALNGLISEAQAKTATKALIALAMGRAA